MAKLKIAHGATVDQGQASGFGGTGGQPSAETSGVKTIALTYNTSANARVASGYIIAQKGAKKFLCGNAAAVGSDITTVTLVDKTNGALEAGEGSITGYDTSSASFRASRITSKHVYDFSGNKYIYKIDTPATATYANVSVS